LGVQAPTCGEGRQLGEAGALGQRAGRALRRGAGRGEDRPRCREIGPIATPEDAQYILRHCPACHGFYGASSMERLPTEVALTETTRRFVQITR
jgi:hypothetical protein